MSISHRKFTLYLAKELDQYGPVEKTRKKATAMDGWMMDLIPCQYPLSSSPVKKSLWIEIF